MRFSDSAIGTVMIIFAGWVLYYTQRFPTLEEGYPGPSLFPNVLAVLFIIAGIGMIIQGVRKGQKFFLFEANLDRTGLFNIFFILAIVLIYIFLADLIGFMILAPILLLASMKWLKVPWKLSLPLSVGVTFGIYVLFAKVLLVPLPWGLWGW